MMLRTHIAFGLAGGLALLPYVYHQWSFIPLVLIATLLPDIDCMHSYLGKHWIFRPLQWCIKHRGVIHSLTFCVITTLLFMLFIPVAALPFFLGFTLHLLGDGVTKEGIRLWWPWSEEIRGPMRTGGTIEKGVFYGLCGVNVLLFLLRLGFI